MSLQVSPSQWRKLQHISDVRPIGDSDEACLEDIRQVLIKHGCLGRFGVSLLHNHFHLDDGEILLETTDVNTREQYLRPVSKAFLEENGITAQTTVITFDERGHNQRCGCNPRSTGHHHL
jgi:hypothetical protein